MTYTFSNGLMFFIMVPQMEQTSGKNLKNGE